jgi:hypothetical protein
MPFTPFTLVASIPVLPDSAESKEVRKLPPPLPEISAPDIRQLLWMTSWVLSLDKKEANVYLFVFVVIRMAFGITNAVIFFSRVMISCIGMASYSSQAQRGRGTIKKRVVIRMTSREGQETKLTSVTQPKILAWKHTWFSEM